jgi:hypothetical protein
VQDLREGIKDIAKQLERNGVGHVVYGGKPVWFIERHDRGSGHDQIARLARAPSLRLCDRFALIRTGPSQDRSTGMLLINKQNLHDVVEKEKEFFVDQFCPGKNIETERLINEHIVPSMKNDLFALQSTGEMIMGVLLGFGVNSAKAFATMSNEERRHGMSVLESRTREAEAEVVRFGTARRALNDVFRRTLVMPAPPQFIPTSDSAPAELVKGYLEDSKKIYRHWSSLKSMPENKRLSKDLLIVSDFLSNLFEEAGR